MIIYEMSRHGFWHTLSPREAQIYAVLEKTCGSITIEQNFYRKLLFPP